MEHGWSLVAGGDYWDDDGADDDGGLDSGNDFAGSLAGYFSFDDLFDALTVRFEAFAGVDLIEKSAGVGEGDEEDVFGGQLGFFAEDGVFQTGEDFLFRLWIDLWINRAVENEEHLVGGLFEDAAVAEALGGFVVKALDGGEASDPSLQAGAALGFGEFLEAIVKKRVAGGLGIDEIDEALFVVGDGDAF